MKWTRFIVQFYSVCKSFFSVRERTLLSIFWISVIPHHWEHCSRSPLHLVGNPVSATLKNSANMLSWCVLDGVHQMLNRCIFVSWLVLPLQLFFLRSLCTDLYIFHCDITKLHTVFIFSSVSVICIQIKCLIYHNLPRSSVSGLQWNIVPADTDLRYPWELIEIKRASHTYRPKGRPRDEWGTCITI